MLAGDIELDFQSDAASTEHDGRLPASVAPAQPVAVMAENTADHSAGQVVQTIRPMPAFPHATTIDRITLDESIDTLAVDLGQTSPHGRRKAGIASPTDRPDPDASPDDKMRADREGGMISVGSHPLPPDDIDDLADQFDTIDLKFSLVSEDSTWAGAPQSPANQPSALRVSNLGQSAVTTSTTLQVDSGTPMVQAALPQNSLPQPALPEKSLPENPVASASPSRDDDGGMIRVFSTTLPATGSTTLSSSVPIQLAPNMGHYRNFRLADAPGLDSERDSDRSSTLVSRSESGDSTDGPRSKRKLRWAQRLSKSIPSSVSVVSGSALLSGELAGRVHPNGTGRTP
ncbi:hypothetical protein Mal15_40590 [Stieleria maiorica]|uniref:Uncharacterized protein n=2 Tax=Stieleria maiorica TaxID=2795974 RepID=A0A5B9MFH0_9BACT|nr:hypothetical protein Mal15_40590 [Stieleria maiorica]